MANILIVGAGGREHALAWKLRQSPQVGRLYVAPGNAGTAAMATNLDIQPTDLPTLAHAARIERIDLTVVGPEAPLAAGLVDFFVRLGLVAFGPTQSAARLESSKVFAKDLMQRAGIPCARSRTFSDFAEAKGYVESQPVPMVVKADGLAAGKGVTVAQTKEEAVAALHAIMEEHVFGAAGSRVLVEECLFGWEASLLALCDGETVLPLAPACDYKRARDGDRGPNTGGMGSFSPPARFTPELTQQVKESILLPAVRALAKEGHPYQGVLYAGLMMTSEGPKALEFNCRFGDPETQVLIPRLEADLFDIMMAVVDRTLDKVQLRWRQEACVGVVLASGGYPSQYETGYPIFGLDDVEEGVLLFHAGTRTGEGGRVETAGGRVLTVAALGPDLALAREKVYRNIPRIQFRGRHYRTDIAAEER
ncbi:MAG: phosphoribosylamine--glycine ligase [Chloroflexi bacterium]|nr:phosphoribosylamine--glycine ligase [Chloroflexota bacterium]